MKRLLLLSALALAAAPVVAAHAGEGNGPDFPGMQAPSVSIVTRMSPYGSAEGNGHVMTTIRHSADAGYEPRQSDPGSSLYTPNTRTWQMLRSVSQG